MALHNALRLLPGNDPRRKRVSEILKDFSKAGRLLFTTGGYEQGIIKGRELQSELEAILGSKKRAELVKTLYFRTSGYYPVPKEEIDELRKRGLI